METQKITVNGMDITIPAYYTKTDPFPSASDSAKAFGVQTEQALCVLEVSEITDEEAIPMNKEHLIQGIRQYLSEQQGIIQVGGEDNYVYSIVKTLMEPHGVQYQFTYQQIFGQQILFIRAYFEEIGMTGIRDNLVLAKIHKENEEESMDDLFARWTRDPYDSTIKEGALMNMSEAEEYDEHFPGFPLSMCRELLHTIEKWNK